MNQSLVNPAELLRMLQTYRWRWLAPAGVIFVAAVGFALLNPAKWEASQSLMVRDEALGSATTAGKFIDAQSRKSALETVMELARSRGVLEAALRQVGPEGSRSAAWPAPADVRDLRQALDLKAPNGVEYGGSEVVHLTVTAASKARAVALTRAVAEQLDARLRNLRSEKAASLAGELGRSVTVAQADLEAATVKMAAVEKQVGADLAELRRLAEGGGAESGLAQSITQIKADLRQLETAKASQAGLLELLQGAQQDARQLIAMPNQLLQSLPSLAQIRDALITAKLNKSRLLGEMSEAHPHVRAAAAAELQIERRLHEELQASIASLRAEIRLADSRAESLSRQLREVQERVLLVNTLRAEYANLAADVKRRGEILNEAHRKLTDARAMQAAAETTSVITRLDNAAAGDAPVGPGRGAIVLFGGVGGLLAGLGLVFLTCPLTCFAGLGDIGGPRTATPEQSDVVASMESPAQSPAAARSAQPAQSARSTTTAREARTTAVDGNARRGGAGLSFSEALARIS